MERAEEIIWLIRKEMRRKKVTTEEIAEVISTSRETVSHKLHGDSRMYIDEMIRICDYLGIDMRFRDERGEWQ